MALPRKTRGEYRPIYEALFNGKDYRKLSADGKLCLLTIKGLAGAIGLKEWPALAASLAERCSITPQKAARAVVELQKPDDAGIPWIRYQDGIVWLVRGLEFEPSVSHGEKHQKWIAKMLQAFPRSPIVEEFRVHYAEFLPERNAPDRSPPRTPRDTPSDSLRDRPSHTPSDGGGHTTSPSPSPVPLPAADAAGPSPASDHQQPTLRVVNSEPPAPEHRTVVAGPESYAEWERELREAFPPHVSHALTVLMNRAEPYTVVWEIHACWKQGRSLRGKHKTARVVQPEHVVEAVWEMATNSEFGNRWSAPLFRGCCSQVCDRDEPLAPEDEAVRRIEAEAEKFRPPVPMVGERSSDGSIVARPFVADTRTELELAEARQAAMDALAATIGRPRADPPVPPERTAVLEQKERMKAALLQRAVS